MTLPTATISKSTDFIKVIKHLRFANTSLTFNHCCALPIEEFLTYSDRLQHGMLKDSFLQRLHYSSLKP